MQLPALPQPQQYVGLFAFDFGTHVSVGYTAGEICVLRNSKEHRGGIAYQVYRVDDDGSIELRGADDTRLSAQEAMCFLRADEVAARRDYEAIRRAAEHDPMPCAVDLELATLAAFTPPHVAGLSYPAPATTLIAGWLTRNAPDAGDRVVGGIDAYTTLVGSQGTRIASCQLRAKMDYKDRSPEEVLRTIHDPLQR